MACIASVVTSLVLGRPVVQWLIINGFVAGMAVSIVTLSVSWWMGFHRRGTGEGSAWFAFVVVLVAGVAVALFR